MKQPPPNPKPGDSVIILRCEEYPMLVGETAEVVDATPGGNFYKVAACDLVVIVGRGDFMLRK